MAEIYEKWEVHIGKKIHIISGKELNLILNAQNARFIRFRDLIINPAFVEQMILIETNAPKLSAPDESDLESEEWLERRVKN